MSQWIAVTERLPEVSQVVVLAHNDLWMNSPAHDPQGLNWYGVGCLGGHDFGKYWYVIGETRYQCLDAVTHWMPLDGVPQ